MLCICYEDILRSIIKIQQRDQCVLVLNLRAYQQFGVLKVQFAQVFTISFLTDWSQLILKGGKNDVGFVMLVFHIKFSRHS